MVWVGMAFSQLEMLPQQWETDCGSCSVKQTFILLVIAQQRAQTAHRARRAAQAVVWELLSYVKASASCVSEATNRHL